MDCYVLAFYGVALERALLAMAPDFPGASRIRRDDPITTSRTGFVILLSTAASMPKERRVHGSALTGLEGFWVWYAARLIYASVKHGTPDPSIFEEMSQEELGQDTFEEVVMLIRAEDDDSALREAQFLGAASEHSYVNKYRETVDWKLVSITEVKELLSDDLKHGTQVFSRFFFRPKGYTGSFDE